MSFLELTTATAPTARSHLPDFTPLPSAQLSTGASAAALSSMQDREHLLIDATLNRLASTLEKVGRFADQVERIDTNLGSALSS